MHREITVRRCSKVLHFIMHSNSDSDSQDNRKDKQPKEEIKQRKEWKKLNEGMEKCQKEPFCTYSKLPGDHSKDFKQMMCAFYALKLIARDDVEDFEIATNKKENGNFGDMELTVAFKNGKKCTYLFHFECKENEEPITINQLTSEKQQSDFDLQKYFNSMSSLNISENSVCILYTNSSTCIEQSTQISENIDLKICDDHLEYEDLLLTVKQTKSSSIYQVVQNLQDKNRMFYFFTEQSNFENTKTNLQKMLHEMLECPIYDSFMHFVHQSWSKSFILRKDDVIAKLTELDVSSYILTVSDIKQNEKTRNLTEAIMNFFITIMDYSDENIIGNIWPDADITDDEFVKTKEKFALEKTERVKISWFLNKIPLILKVDDSNKTTIGLVIRTLNKCSEKRRIVLVGNVTKGEFDGMDVFQNLSDLIIKAEIDELCHNILHTFNISLQGRELICLEQLIATDREIAEHVRVRELLKMSQTNYIIGNEKQELSKLHIPRSVYTTFVKTQKILSIYESQKNQTVVVINCDPTFKDRFLTRKNYCSVEIADYFRKEYSGNDNVIIFSTEHRLTHAEFVRVCEKSNKSNVYLLQSFDAKSCVLLLEKGNKLPSDVLDESKCLPERDILKYLDNPLNAVCASPGMGKSTLMKGLSNKCPSHYWAIYIDLRNCNSFLAKKPDSTAICDYFLRADEAKDETEKQIKNILQRNQKLYLYLDELDQVNCNYLNCVLDFIKEASSNGVKVWISLRENLRQTVSHALNVVPLEIRQLSREEQEEYMCNRLKEKYETEEITNILDAVFASVDLNNSQQLLENPFHLQLIAEMFLNNDDFYRKFKAQNIFLLTQMYELFLFRSVSSILKRAADEQETYLSGDIKILLKQYEVIALKACLDNKDFERLRVDLKESQGFINNLRKNGDAYGIIKEINEKGEATFGHRTYAEYFACIWLKENKEKVVLLKDVIFAEKYKNLRLMLDIMLAENNPLHLSIIYKNFKQFEKYKHEINTKDEGGRTPWQLICMHGMKYPVSCFQDMFHLVRLNRELDCYVFMAKTVVQEQNDIITNNHDDLFNFTWLNYCLEAKCLYPIELILELKLVKFSDINKKVYEYYIADTLAYYSAQMGYPNLFSAAMAEDSGLARHESLQNLMEAAVIGPKDKNKNSSFKADTSFESLEGYRRIIQLVLESGLDVNARLEHGLTAFQLSCRHGNYEITKMLLDFGSSVNLVDMRDNTALQCAVELQKVNLDIIKLLTEKGVDVNAQNKFGMTALQLACQQGVYENAKMLLDFGASINIADKDNKNLLHYASWKDNKDIIKILIDKGIDVNAQDKLGKTALHFACEQTIYGNVEMLLSVGASINLADIENRNVLHSAALSWKDNRDVMKLLLEKGIDINAQDKNGATALQLAWTRSVCENAKTLLDFGASTDVLDHNKQNVLHYASKSWNADPDLIKAIIDKGIDVNAQDGNGTTPLQVACKNGNYEITELLLNFGTSINIADKRNKNAFHYAAESWTPNRSKMKLLIENGIDVNAQTETGTTALQLACQNGDAEIAEMLVKSGASVNMLDKNNENALHYASKSWAPNRFRTKLLIEKSKDVIDQNKSKGTVVKFPCRSTEFEMSELVLDRGISISIVDKNKYGLHSALELRGNNQNIIKLLTQKGIDINAQNQNGTTALQLACAKHSHEITEMLLDSGASVNIVDKDNKNALHYGLESWEDNRDIIKSLIKKGIDVNALNKNGTTALQLACENSDYEIAEMLLDFGAFLTITDKDNRNLLDYASGSRKITRYRIKVVLQEGSVEDAQGVDETTDAQLTYRNVDSESTEVFLDSGISVSIINTDNRNTLRYISVARKTNQDIINLLTERGRGVYMQEENGARALQCVDENPECSTENHQQQ
ncbi:uncharacterized protein LOC135129711 [Zophobas morio]|uniref:uncharacterized protein LOC135129711 n=1 Tax=Zophobas morio TaxID=2755281 RepID=UPI0030836E14